MNSFTYNSKCLIALVAAALLAGPGCLMTKEEGKRLQARLKHQEMLLQDLKENQRLAQANLRKSIKEVFQEIKEKEKKDVKHKSDLAMEIQDLEKEILKVNGKLEEEEFKTQKLEKELDEDRQVYSTRFTDLETRLAAVEEAFKQLKDQTGQEQGKLVVSRKEPKTPKDEYGQALAVFKLGDAELARKLFKEFIKKHPGHALAGNAQYWLAETYFEAKDYRKAILEYQKVREKYKKTDKSDDALLKLGYCFAELGLKKEARIFLKELISKYPRSSAAKKAKAKLKELRGKRSRGKKRK